MRKSLSPILATLALGFLVAGCSGSNTTEGPDRIASSAAGTVTPIDQKTCSSKTGTQAFFGKLEVLVWDTPIWLMSADVDCGGWSGRSNPTKLAKVGPSHVPPPVRPTPKGFVNPFRLEVSLGKVRPQWRMRIVKKAADGTFKKIYSFKLTFAPFPKKSGYNGVFLCFTTNCQDVTAMKRCDDIDSPGFPLDCGFPPPAPRPVRGTTYLQKGTVWRTPVIGGLGPFIIETETYDDPAKGRGSFTLSIVERREMRR